MSLIRTTNLWGEAHIMYGDPKTTIVKNVYYVPYEHNSCWGIFDHQRNSITDALDLWGSDRIPHQKHLVLSSKIEADEIIEGDDLIYLGWLNPHFGHFLINSLPKFWPFYSFGGASKILLSSPIKQYPEFVKSIIRGIGLCEEDFISFDRPVRIKSLIVPSSSVLEQYWAYTIFRDLCLKIGSSIYDVSEVNQNSKPVYLSKSKLTGGVGRFANENLIEDIVRSANIDICHPESLSFEDQVRLFAHRKLLIGPTGSAFHTSVFAPTGRQMICYNPSREINSNFVLLDAISGHQSSYYFQEGMTYTSSPEFLTIVHARDAEGLGIDLVRLARERVYW